METKIEMRQVSEVKPYEKNAKKHPKSQIEQIARSIQEFGFNQPIVVDANGVIIVGHGRYLAATEVLKMDHVPTVTVDISEEQAKAYRLADNKLNESDWDMKLVIEELKDLSAPMVDLTGFSSDLIIENSEKNDQVPEEPKVVRSKEGDLYVLGSDPPYNVDYEGKTKDALKIQNDKKSDGDFRQFLRDAFAGVDAH
ncbi:TPA: DNA modification methylase, partial [Candidatus Wolfebacteria bacterium]|nr:DNA modification methylase [Candidatus Wolfebacteria bacterium]